MDWPRFVRAALWPLAAAAAVAAVPVAIILWGRADLAAGRGALEPVARLFWSLTGPLPTWALAYRRSLPAAAIAVGAASLMLAAPGFWLGRRRSWWRLWRGALGLAALAVGLAVMARPSPYLWILAALAGALFLGWRPAAESPAERPQGWRLAAAALAVTLLAALPRYAHIERFDYGISGHSVGHLLHSYRSLGALLAGEYPHADYGAKAAGWLHYLFAENNGPQHLIDMASLPLLGWDYVGQRMTAALIGVLTVPIVLLLGRRLFGASAGMAAALLLAVSPWHHAWSRYESSPLIHSFTHQAVGLLLLAVFLQAGPGSLRTATGPGRRGRWAVALGLWTGGACLLHASGQVYPAAVALVLAVETAAAVRRRAAWRTLALWSALAMALAGGVYLVRFAYVEWSLPRFLNTYIAGDFRLTPALMAGNAATTLRQLFVEARGMHILYMKPHGLIEPGLMLLAILGLGIALARPLARSHLILLAAILASLPSPILSSDPAPRRLGGLLVPLCLLAGLAWQRLRRPLGRAALPVGALAAAGAAALQLAMYFGAMIDFESEKSYSSTLGAQLAGELIPEHAVIVLTDEGPEIPGLNFEHFQSMNLEELERLGPGYLAASTLDDLEQTLARLEGFPAPPLMLAPYAPRLEAALALVAGANPAVVTRNWETPRSPDVQFLLVRLPTRLAAPFGAP